MRWVLAHLVAVAALLTQAHAQGSQTCTGLCQLQVSCPAGQSTTVSGTVYAPNGTDPLPNVLVYIPNAPVDAFTPGVSCPVPGQPPSGSPLVGASTAFDGTFTLTNVPVGSNIPIVIQAGRWRRQLIVPGTAACTNTTFNANMPRNKSEGDIPKVAIATGSVDQVECVLRKVGIDDAEFTNPSGSGRINLYSSAGNPGALIDSTTPSANVLFGNSAVLNQYDALMLPCEGAAFTKPSAQLANFLQYANAGGRVYASHFSYVWMYTNPPFDTVVSWHVNQAQLPDGIATVNTTFPDGVTLAQWLQLVGASTTQGQMPLSVVRHDLDSVNSPTLSWLNLNESAGNPVMQFTFDAPVGNANQCGRVLFNEYHVENPPAGTTPTNKPFPTECPNIPMTPQEKLLEFSLFDLTNQGGEPTLDSTTYDFGSEPVGFTSASHSFTLKNTSVFAITVGQPAVTGDFVITNNTCSSIPAGGTCTVDVAFRPTALGKRTGTLSVATNSKVLTATLTGTGIPDLATTTSNAINFGNVDVGATATRSLTFTNTSPGPVTLPTPTVSGDYSLGTTCATIPAGTTCTINIIFKPTTTGIRTGTLSDAFGDPAIFGLPAQLTGNGVDFTLALSSNSGKLIAGREIDITATVTPVADFPSTVYITCVASPTAPAPASTCTPSPASFIPSSPTASTIAITTTSQYTVIGYGGLFPLLGLATGALLFYTRRRSTLPARLFLWTIVLATTGLFTTGCSGKYPDKNAFYTPPGTYTYTITATDDFLTRTATYTLTVMAK